MAINTVTAWEKGKEVVYTTSDLINFHVSLGLPPENAPIEFYNKGLLYKNYLIYAVKRKKVNALVYIANLRNGIIYTRQMPIEMLENKGGWL